MISRAVLFHLQNRFLPTIFPSSWLGIALPLLALVSLYVIGHYDFLLFHAMIEAYSIIVAIAVFVIFWNTRQLLQTGFYLVVGLGCLSAGIFDLIYIGAYPGMSLFPRADGNIALQAKTVAQWYVSLSCVAAFYYLHRKADAKVLLVSYAGVAAVAAASIFYWKVFPDCYLPEIGVTRFARLGLIASCSAYLLALALLLYNRREFDNRIAGILAATLVVFFLQDAVSAIATELDGAPRIVAHLCQAVALFFVYKAFVEVGLREPYNLLFRNLQQRAEDIKRINKTLHHRAEQLRALASELTLTEQRERRRLAQILHDNLQQMLVAAKMQLKRIKEKPNREELLPSLIGIDELLDQSIMESRSLTAELSPPVLFDRGLVGGLEWLARQFRQKHQLPLMLQLAPSAEPADDAVRIFLYHAARELLFNAVKHAQARTVLVQLNRCEGDWLELVVTDDGQGFDPHRVTDHDLGGFGLFSIRERSEFIGGDLKIVSAPGQGTTIVLRVLRGQQAPAAKALELGLTKAQQEREISASPRIRVLLADDHPVLRKGLSDLLDEQSEIEVVAEAHDGEDALEQAILTRPDVVLMDVTMPRLSGIEATRRILASLPQVRIIGLSMHEDEDMAQAMHEAGAVAYLNKSEASETLVAMVIAQGVRCRSSD